MSAPGIGLAVALIATTTPHPQDWSGWLFQLGSRPLSLAVLGRRVLARAAAESAVGCSVNTLPAVEWRSVRGSCSGPSRSLPGVPGRVSYVCSSVYRDSSREAIDFFAQFV